MQKISVLTVGSRGDVQPFIALCLALEKSGYQTRLITYSKFESLINQYGLEFFPITNSYEKQLVDIIRTPGNPFSAPERIQRAIGPILDKVLLESWQGCQGADAIVNAATAFWGFDIAERLLIPSVSVGLIPLRPTEDFPHCVAPQVSILGFINKLSGYLVTKALWAGYGESINRWRQETLDLPGWRKPPFETRKWRAQLELLAYSPALVPQPKDWQGNIHTTGFLFLDESQNFAPEKPLTDFLSNGEKPVYVGFGSMAIEKSERHRLAMLFSNALRRTGKRGIFQGEICEGLIPDNHIYCLGSSIPHSWLLPKVSIMIHHGGVGTTGASLRAACPSLTLPFYSDQPFWANRLYEAGVCSQILNRNTVTEDKVVEELRRIDTEPLYREKAERLSSIVRKESGLGKAVSLISEHVR